MLNKKIQITENVTIKIGRFKETTLKVDSVKLYYKEELIGSFISSSISHVSSKTSVCLYELVDVVASETAQAFLLGCHSQKEVMNTLKGLKNIREDLTNENCLIFAVFLESFDIN